MIVGGIYLVTAFEVQPSRWQDQSLSEVQDDTRPRAAPQASRSPRRTGAGGGIRRGDVSGGGVPAWARPEPNTPPPTLGTRNWGARPLLTERRPARGRPLRTSRRPATAPPVQDAPR